MTAGRRQVETCLELIHESTFVAVKVLAYANRPIVIHDRDLESISRHECISIDRGGSPQHPKTRVQESILVDISERDLPIGMPERTADLIKFGAQLFQ